MVTVGLARPQDAARLAEWTSTTVTPEWMCSPGLVLPDAEEITRLIGRPGTVAYAEDDLGEIIGWAYVKPTGFIALLFARPDPDAFKAIAAELMTWARLGSLRLKGRVQNKAIIEAFAEVLDVDRRGNLVQDGA